MQSQTARDGYNKIATMYMEQRGRLRSEKYVRQLLKYLPKQSTVLDLGCGGGAPVDDLLLKAGHRVIGIDLSPKMIEMARKLCPRGQYLVGDIRELSEGEYSVQVVVSFYTFFHIPREEQARLLKTIASFLPKGGILLITMGDREFEGTHQMHGEEMWASQYGTERNRRMVEAARFKVILDEIDASGGERHQIILGEKRV